MYKISFIAFIASFIVSTGYGQNAPVSILRGLITDAATGEPVSYATVGVARHSINTMSNEKGRFVFKVPEEYRHDTIYITHVGFHPIAITIDPADTGFRTIQLREQ